MNKKMLALIIIALLAGTGIGYSVSMPQVSKLQSETSALKTDYDFLESALRARNRSYDELLETYTQLKEAYDFLIKYFFIQDSNFSVPLDSNAFWGVEAWNKNPDSVCEIKDGTLYLFYNGTIDYSYGNSGLFQGTHTYGGYTHQLLVGDSLENAYYSDYAIFPKNLLSGEFLLETKFRIINMGFNLYPTVYDTEHARVNLGITLMCAINNQPLNLTGQNLWLDVYFAGYSLNETGIWLIPKNLHYVDETGDIHAGYFVGEVHPQDFGKWISMQIDLGDYISKTLNLITKIDIKTIRVYGFIVFVECLGAYAEVEYAYANTIRN